MDDTLAKGLAGKRVVVTRAAEQSESLLTALRENGAEPVSLPMVTFAPPDDYAPLDLAIRKLRQFDWLFFTSQNALRALEKRALRLKLPLTQAAAGIQIAVVGPATAEAVQRAGLWVTYIAKKHQGVSLAQELAPDLKNAHVLLPRSDRANRALLTVLNTIGAHVTEVIAYKTVRPGADGSADSESLLRQGADAVLFFSPSAVHHLQDLLNAENFCALSRKSVFTAVGPVTEHALRQTGVERVVLARDTTVKSVLEALSAYFLHPARSGVKQG